MSWTLLLAVVAFAVVAGFWHASLAARELANRVALETCEQARVQLLDGTVSIHRLALVRPGGGTLALRRTYVFDYSEDGYNRRRGFIVVTGRSVDTVGLGPRPT